MPGASCCVAGCWKSPQSRHRFPNPAINKPLFDRWIVLCGNKRLQVEMTLEQIYNNCRVCSLHFVPQDFGCNNKLKKGVLPSLNLPDPLQSITGISVPTTITTEPDNANPSTSRQEHDYAIPSTSSQCVKFQLLDTKQDKVTASTSKSNSRMISSAAPKIKVEIIGTEESQQCLKLSDNGISRVISSDQPKIKVEVIKTEESQKCMDLSGNGNHQKVALNSQNFRQILNTTLQGISMQNMTSNKPLRLRQVQPFKRIVLKQIKKMPAHRAEVVKNMKFVPNILRSSLLTYSSKGKKCMLTRKEPAESAIVDLTLDEDETATYGQTQNNENITSNTEQKSSKKLSANKQNIHNEEPIRTDIPDHGNVLQENMVKNWMHLVRNKSENSCVYLTCSRVKNNETRFSKFPIEYNRALTWLALCNRSDILRKNLREIEKFLANTSGLCLDHYNEMCAKMPNFQQDPDSSSKETKDNTPGKSREKFAIKICGDMATVDKGTGPQTGEATTSKKSSTTEENKKIDESAETYIPVKEYCAFVNCCTHVKNPSVRKYRYPKSPDLLKEWVHASGIPNGIDENHLKCLFVCGKHFTEDQYTSRNTLQVASVPVPHDLYVDDPDAMNCQPHWIRKQRLTRKKYTNQPARKMYNVKPRVSLTDCSPFDTRITANKRDYTRNSKPLEPPIQLFKDSNFNSGNTVHQTSTSTYSQPPSLQKCVIRHCQADEKSNVLFKFPSHRSRLELWIKAVEDRAYIPEHVMSVYLTKKICCKHFEKRFQIRDDSLSPEAIPTLDLLDTKNIRADEAPDADIVWKQSQNGVFDQDIATRYIKGKVVLHENSIEYPNLKRKLRFNEDCPKRGMNRFPYNVYRLPLGQSVIQENVKVGHQLQIHSAIIIDDDDESEKRTLDMIWKVIKNNDIGRSKKLRTC